MEIYFDAQGRVIEIADGGSIRVGDYGADQIAFFMEGADPATETQEIDGHDVIVNRNKAIHESTKAFISFRLPDGTYTAEQEISIEPSVEQFPTNPKRDYRKFKDGAFYEFVRFDIPRGIDGEGNPTPIPDVLAQNGLVGCTVRLLSQDDQLKSLGMITFTVEDATVKPEEWATASQYNYLLTLIGKAGIRTVVGTYQELQNLNTNELNDGDVIEVISDSTQGGNLSFYGYSAETGEFTLIGALGQYVTTNTAQTITADKTLTGNLTKSTYLGDIKFATGSTQKPILEFTSNQPGTAANVVVETVSPYPADSVRHIQQLQNKDGIIALKSDIDAAIEEIEQKSDVTDIVGTHADLEDYDTSTLANNDIIKVLQDETQGNATTYYKWNSATNSFTLIGSEGPYYTQTQADGRFGQLAATNIWTGQNVYRAVPLVFQNTYGGIEVGRIEESVDDYSLDVTQSHSVGALELISKGYGVRIQTGSTPTGKWTFDPNGDLLPEGTNTGKNIGSSIVPIADTYQEAINFIESGSQSVYRIEQSNSLLEITVDGRTCAIFDYNETKLPGTLNPITNGGQDLGSNGSKWRNLYVNGITGASGTTVPTDAVINKTLGGYDTSSVSIIDYNTQRIMSIATATTFTLLGAPTGNFHPEYRLKLTNSSSTAVAATFTGVSHIITNDSNATVSGNVLTLSANSTYEISIQDGDMVAINFEA